MTEIPPEERVLVYRCERGHAWSASNEWYGEGGLRVEPPMRLVCVARWGADICGLFGYRAMTEILHPPAHYRPPPPPIVRPVMRATETPPEERAGTTREKRAIRLGGGVGEEEEVCLWLDTKCCGICGSPWHSWGEHIVFISVPTALVTGIGAAIMAGIVLAVLSIL